MARKLARKVLYKSKIITIFAYRKNEFNMEKTKPNKAQGLADKFTAEVMTEKYGKRFTDISDVEEDEEMNRMWEFLNEEFYELLMPII